MNCKNCKKKLGFLFSHGDIWGNYFCSPECKKKYKEKSKKVRKEKWEQAKKEYQKNKGKKIIKETKCVCSVCGKVWHFGKEEQLEAIGDSMQNIGKSLMCCGGCLPAVFIPDKKIKDLNRCPECNSKNIKCNKVIHYVE